MKEKKFWKIQTTKALHVQLELADFKEHQHLKAASIIEPKEYQSRLT